MPLEARGPGWLEVTQPEDRAEAERTFLDAKAPARLLGSSTGCAVPMAPAGGRSMRPRLGSGRLGRSWATSGIEELEVPRSSARIDVLVSDAGPLGG